MVPWLAQTAECGWVSGAGLESGLSAQRGPVLPQLLRFMKRWIFRFLFPFFNCSEIYIRFIILAILKCTVRWHYIRSQCCANITTIRLQNFHLLEQTPYPLNTNSDPPSPSLWHPPSTFCCYEFNCSRDLI